MHLCTILMDTVAEVLDRELRSFSASERIAWTQLRHDCLFLLVAYLPCQLSDRASRVLALCFSRTSWERFVGTVFELFESTEADTEMSLMLCLHLQARLLGVFLRLDPRQLYTATASILLRARSEPTQDYRIYALLGRQATPLALKEQTCRVLATYMLHQTRIGANWTAEYKEIVISILHLWPTSSFRRQHWGNTLNKLIGNLLTDSKYAPHFIPLLFHPVDFVVNCNALAAAAFLSRSGKFPHAVVLL